MSNLQLTIVQSNLKWEQRGANLDHHEKLLKDADRIGDLILLPEMFSTGFSMEPDKLWDETNGETLTWLRSQADLYNAAISGSIIVKEGGDFYNRLFFVKPNGDFDIYDKRHLFTLAGEDKIYGAGKKHLIVSYKGWRIMPLICYDLRFPVWSRNTQDIDLMYFVANWPERRSEAWSTLLKARAIENMCYVAGVNRVGLDGNNVMHSGDSVLHNELGTEVWKAPAGTELVTTHTINKDQIKASQKRFQFLEDRDGFVLTD